MTTPAVLILSGPIITALAASVIASSGAGPVSDDVKSFTAFAIIGAALGVAFCFFLLDRAENRRQTSARIIAGAFAGVALPRVGQKYFSLVHDFLSDPLLVVTAGFVSCFTGYFIMYAAFRKIAKREEVVADAAIKAGVIAARGKLNLDDPTEEKKSQDDRK